MNNKDEMVSVDSYISSLLMTPSIDTTDDEDCAEDSYDVLVDDLFLECVDQASSTTSPAKVYLSFNIDRVSYIVPSTQVVTVARYVSTERPAELELYDAFNIFHAPSVNVSNRRFSVVLKGVVDYALLVDAINGVVSMRDKEILFRNTVTNRPWYRGISIDREYMLLDTYTLSERLELVNRVDIVA